MIAQTSSLAKAFVLAVASFGMFSAAFPASEMEERAIFTPRVTYPHTGTVWYKGDAHNVTWYFQLPLVTHERICPDALDSQGHLRRSGERDQQIWRQDPAQEGRAHHSS